MTVLLETERLRLRSFTAGDVDHLYGLNGDRDVMWYLSGGKPTPELRDYGVGAQILVDLGVREMILLTTTHRTIVGLEGYGLTTANILYHMPDHPGILQNYIWQQHDLHPHFPELRKFLDFWSRELEGLLHSVTVAHARLINQ